MKLGRGWGGHSLHWAPDLHLANLAAIADGARLKSRRPARETRTVCQDCILSHELSIDPLSQERSDGAAHCLVNIVHRLRGDDFDGCNEKCRAV